MARLAYLRNLYMLYILYVSTFVSNLHFHRRKCWDMCQLSRHVPTGNMSSCMSTERVCIVQRHVSKYLSISYYIGVVSLMCEDTLHHNVWIHVSTSSLQHVSSAGTRVPAWLLCSAPLSGCSLLPADPNTKTVRRGLHITSHHSAAAACRVQTAAARTLHKAHWLS